MKHNTILVLIQLVRKTYQADAVESVLEIPAQSLPSDSVVTTNDIASAISFMVKDFASTVISASESIKPVISSTIEAIKPSIATTVMNIGGVLFLQDTIQNSFLCSGVALYILLGAYLYGYVLSKVFRKEDSQEYFKGGFCLISIILVFFSSPDSSSLITNRVYGILEFLGVFLMLNRIIINIFAIINSYFVYTLGNQSEIKDLRMKNILLAEALSLLFAIPFTFHNSQHIHMAFLLIYSLLEGFTRFLIRLPVETTEVTSVLYKNKRSANKF